MTKSVGPTLTVFTPTYNRAHTLPRLYESLVGQQDHDFEWLLIDDGSTDGTAEVVAAWVEENPPFRITYHLVPNGGKPRAITLACGLATGEYLFIVDSDDRLVDDAISVLKSWIVDSLTDPDCAGVGGVRGWTSGDRPPPFLRTGEGYVRASNLERTTVGIVGEMNEAYRVDVLRAYPFPVWPGEKFVPEQVVFNSMAIDGWYLHWYDEVICVGDYQADGLTVNADRLEARNPMGYAMLANHKLKYSHGRPAFRAAIQHIALSLVGGGSRYILETNRPSLTLAALPFGFLLSFRRRRQFRDRLRLEGNA